MASDPAVGFLSLSDPYWTIGDYARFADHPSADVRLWALGRLDELGLEIPEEILRRRLEDVDLPVATTAAELVGRLEVTSLADVLHARLERAEDAVGAACAASLARLGDQRVVNLIRRQSHLPVESRDPRIWLALSELNGPEAQDSLLQAFGNLSSPTGATTASFLSKALMLADPERGIPQVVRRWAGEADDDQADALLHGLLLLCALPEGPEALRDALEPDQESPEIPLPQEILDGLAELLPLGPIRDIRKLWRSRWPPAPPTKAMWPSHCVLFERWRSMRRPSIAPGRSPGIPWGCCSWRWINLPERQARQASSSRRPWTASSTGS